METKAIRTLGQFTVKSNRELYYPPILDYNPKYAANYMTKEDSEIALKRLKDVLIKGDDTWALLKKSIKASSANYEWFVELFKELNKIVTGKEISVEETKLTPRRKLRDTLYLLPPLIYKRKEIVEEKFPPNINDTVNRYRYLYIKKCVQLEDFRDGYPTWYALSNMTIYEKYNPMTNVRVRIDFINGEFRYFISGASDNWKEISGVPLEMDHITSALLFRS